MKKIIILLLVSFPIIVSAQNVGIGKTNPQAKLEIKQTTNLEPTVMLSDSSGNFAGRLRFRSLFSQYNNRSWYTDYKVGTHSKDNEIFLYNDSTNVMNIYGTGNITIGDAVAPNARLTIYSDNPSSDMLNIFGSTQALKILGNGNVGIKNPTPAEALDVTGNINVTGTIKANGNDGNAGQVLMKNSGGFLSWGDMCEYKKYVIYNFTTSGAIQPFTVPAGVTKIKIQVWGGGGQGTSIGGGINMSAGGGGGGYIEGYMNVVPLSTVNVVVGRGASLSFSTSSSSQIDQGGIAFIASGGGNAVLVTTPFTYIIPGSGGNHFAVGTTNYIGVNGEAGDPSNLRYDQISATEYGRFSWGGDGGNAGNTTQTKGKASQFYFNITAGTTLSSVFGTNGLVPGGGLAVATAGGQSAGDGRVVIYY